MIESYRVTVRSADDAYVITLEGEIDTLAKHAVAAAVADACNAKPKIVEIDLAGVTFCDSSCIHEVLRAIRASEQAGIELHVTNAPPIIRRTFEIAGLADLLNA